jgi:hypothetical protein
MNELDSRDCVLAACEPTWPILFPLIFKCCCTCIIKASLRENARSDVVVVYFVCGVGKSMVELDKCSLFLLSQPSNTTASIALYASCGHTCPRHFRVYHHPLPKRPISILVPRCWRPKNLVVFFSGRPPFQPSTNSTS